MDDQVFILSFVYFLLVNLENGDELIFLVDFEFGSLVVFYDFGEDVVLVEDNCVSNLMFSLSVEFRIVFDCVEFGFLG